MNKIGIEIKKIDIGRINFQFSSIRRSKRKRGSVARIQSIKILIKIIISILNGMLILPKNKIVEKILKIIILIYSDKKINANHPPINSTLNPETNSDSPSAKSNGLRFTSAKHLINHIVIIIRFPQKNISRFWDWEILKNE